MTTRTTRPRTTTRVVRTGRRAALTAPVAAVVVAATLTAGPPAAGVATTDLTPVDLVPGTEGRALLTGVSGTDPAKLLVTVFPDEASPATGPVGVHVVDSATRAVTTVYERGPSSPYAGYGADISADGRFVLWAGDPSGLTGTTLEQVFVRDLTAPGSDPVSVSSSEAFAQGVSDGVELSDDGRYAVFNSDAANLVGEPADDRDTDVFLRDRTSGTTTRISDASATAAGANCYANSASADASTVLYTCEPPESAAGESYLWQRATGLSAVVPAPADVLFYDGEVSEDGSTVVLPTFSADDVPGFRSEVLVLDVASGTTTALGVEALDDALYASASLSADERFVLIEVLSLGDEFAPSEVHLHDRTTGITTDVSAPLVAPDDGVYVGAGEAVFGAGNRVWFTSDGELGAPAPFDTFVARYRTYIPPPAASAPAGFVAVPATRVASKVAVGDGLTAHVDLSRAVPAGATAAAVNVTLSGITSRTFVSVCPAGTAQADCTRTSAINPYQGRDVANLAFAQLGDARVLQVYNDEGRATLDVDLVGYFTASGSAAADFAPVAPARDDQELVLGAGTSGVVQLDAVPAGATAAAVRVTAAGVSANTYLSVCRADLTVDACRTSSALNARQQDTSNLAIVPISAVTGNRVRVYNNAGSVIVRTDVVGWFVPAGSGSRFVASTPQRVQERDPLGPGGSLTRTYASRVPNGATAVAANVTTAGNTAVSYVSVCPGGTPLDQCRRTSTVNPNPGQDTASSTLARLGPARDLLYFTNAGSTLLFTDLQGWFVPAS